MRKVTLAVLDEKLNNIHEILVKDIKPCVKENTEFRLKARGMMTMLSIFMAGLGAAIMFIIKYIPR